MLMSLLSTAPDPPLLQPRVRAPAQTQTNNPTYPKLNTTPPR
ncbi:unnamed protein product [Penicillium salamii]|nr:unnamed protein product [Penicillium salamii]